MTLFDHPRLSIGARNLLFSFACTVLVATEVAVSRAAVLPQTAEAYYFSSGRATVYHGLAIAVDLAVLVLTLAWITLPALGKWLRPSLIVLALAGLFLCWSELAWAAHPASHRVFLLRELPFRPLANYGLGGALVFGSYLVFSLPSGRLSTLQQTMVKTGLAVCLLSLQLIAWDGIARNAGLLP
ncbi:MAG: hypothetical protein JSS66_08785 [Armatimonadetes bacterium]|nr:hypothetical protein [Armatimonadota bacterium]